jgi:uncharacterized RmlC-like cupin family protein
MDNDVPRTCRLIRPAESFVGKQGFSYLTGISGPTAGAERICMVLLTVPPGQWARPHQHDDHETAIYTLSGRVDTWYGENLEHHVVGRAGDFLFIPPGCPHLPVNLGRRPATCVIARTDPNEQESVHVREDLEPRVEEIKAELARRHRLAA